MYDFYLPLKLNDIPDNSSGYINMSIKTTK